jgi:hypothetical protein
VDGVGVSVVVVWFLAGGAVEVLNNLLRHWSVARLGLRGRPATPQRSVGDVPRPTSRGLRMGPEWPDPRSGQALPARSERGPSVTGFVVAFVIRLGATSLVLVLAFRQGLAPGLAALVGYWICRWVMVWWMTRSLSRTNGIR